jgi:DNA-directed RNA polymerase subunit omega
MSVRFRGSNELFAFSIVLLGDTRGRIRAMARVFAVDCLEAVPNRFDLALLAAHRARELHNGALSSLPKNGHSAPVLALKEISVGEVNPCDIKGRLIETLQRVRPDDDGDSPEFERIDENAMLRAIEAMEKEAAQTE